MDMKVTSNNTFLVAKNSFRQYSTFTGSLKNLVSLEKRFNISSEVETVELLKSSSITIFREV